MGAMTPPSEELLQLSSTEINRVVDGDTIDVINLILDLIYTRKKELEFQELIRNSRSNKR